MNELLSVAYIAQAQSTAALDDVTDAFGHEPGHRKAKRRRPAHSKRDHVISLTDMRRFASPPSYGSASDVESDGSTSSALLQARNVDNRWTTLDSSASYLADLLDVRPAVIKSAIHSAGLDEATALDTLIIELAHSRPFSTLPQASQKLVGLLHIFM